MGILSALFGTGLKAAPAATGVKRAYRRKRKDKAARPSKVIRVRVISKRLSAILGEHGRAVVTVGKKGKLKVYSLDGYQSASAHATKNKPWLTRGQTKAVKKTRRGKRRQYVHWTQRPENAHKLAKVALNLARWRASR